MSGGKYRELCQKGKDKQLYEGVVGGGVDPWNLFPCPQYRRPYTAINLFLNYLLETEQYTLTLIRESRPVRNPSS